MALLLGIDGGSTKTTGVIMARDCRVLGQARGRGSAIIGSPSPEAGGVLATIVSSLCDQVGASRHDVHGCGIGLSGIDFDDEFAMQHREISAAVGIDQEHVILVNDGIVALWGATAKPAATIIQHGSGFTSAYRSQHGKEALFDHLGVTDVVDLRHALVTRVARMVKGMEEPTPLKDRVLAHFGVEDAGAYCEAVYRGLIPRSRRASTPPLIYQAWLEGDPAATDLVHKAADDYALAARAMIGKTGSSGPDATFGGGVIAAAPALFWALLAERVHAYHPDATVKPPDLPPEFGAAVMAGYHIGLNPVKLFQQLLANAQEVKQ